MLYLDYSREAGEWVPNQYGGRENLDAVCFLRSSTRWCTGTSPGCSSIAEETTAWPGVTRPTYLGGLGFGFKWNMGWMHDTLAYFPQDPVYRRYHQNDLTFGMLYAYSRELHPRPLPRRGRAREGLDATTRWPRRTGRSRESARALRLHVGTSGQEAAVHGRRVRAARRVEPRGQLDWHLLESIDHSGVQSLVRDLNHAYQREPALWELDSTPEGFYWLEVGDADNNVLAFARQNAGGERWSSRSGPLTGRACRLSPGAAARGGWRELVNTDSRHYGGSDVGNAGGIDVQAVPWHGQPYSAKVTLPPLAALWLVPDARG